eukprot:NODE_268_length_12243_cov_0.338109.p7 type:complete len:105 gc:universal NODE_268_length_12243_cov_0.338109:766-1080(+)
MSTVPFKNEDYSKITRRKRVAYKTFLEKERSRPMDVITYTSVTAPPSFFPNRKYCDITGLEAQYTDPKTGLRFHNQEVYAYIRGISQFTAQEYLKIRNANQGII